MKQKLFLWVFPPFVLTIIAALTALMIFTFQSTTRFFFDLSSIELKETGHLVQNVLSPFLLGNEVLNKNENLQASCDRLTEDTQIRITVINPDGFVVADTEANPQQMDIHLDREEVKEAIASGNGSAIRQSVSTAVVTAYEASAILDENGNLRAILRVAMPLSIIDTERSNLLNRMLTFGLIIVFLVAAGAIFLSTRLVQPILRIYNGARSFSAGNLNEHIPEEGPQEVANLAIMMNKMANILDKQIRTVNEQKSQTEAILQGMSEAVAVIDKDMAIHKSNSSFKVLFPALDSPSLLSRTRSTELCDFVATVIGGGKAMETELTIFGENAKQLLLTASPLDDGKAILVVSDLTRLNRLEMIRKDFTSNVSHELKTPITSVKAALETIQDSEGIDQEHRDAFLNIAVRGVKRMESIIEDLLSLARIEEEEKKGIQKAAVSIDTVIETALAEISRKSGLEKISITGPGKTGMTVLAHEGLVVQALLNLLDNAVKYASDFGPIQVTCENQNGFAVLSVKDCGPGIPHKDRARLFERFYRVDKARSRDSGGTGLGLSIVKHIAKAMNGSVRLESTEGAGSVFSICIPLA